MHYLRQRFRFTCVAGAIVMALTGCTYSTALQQLPAAEQTILHAHSKMMTSAQVRAYLHKATPAERTAYLEEIGAAQRFRALSPEDRQAVLAGFPRKGMSADAMRFLWGEPYHTEGRTGHYEHWYYLGSSWSLADSGSLRSEAGTMVIVYLIDGQVEWWLETSPDVEDDDGSTIR